MPSTMPPSQRHESRGSRALQGRWSRRRDARTTTKAGLRRPSRAGPSVARPRLMQQSGDADEAAALVLAVQHFMANGEGWRQVGAARVLHRRGGRAAVAVRVGVAGGVPEQQCRVPGSRQPALLEVAHTGSEPDRLLAGSGLLIC
jgi:hypothetical protein